MRPHARPLHRIVVLADPGQHLIELAAQPLARDYLRHAISYGTHTEHANRLCRLQGRRLHDHLTAAITADLNGQQIPAPLPP